VWKWSFIAAGSVLALFFVLLTWQCGAALRDRSSADALVRRFHEQLNRRDYESIYGETSSNFAQTGKHDELVTFLSAVRSKLGDAGAEHLLTIVVNSTTGGTFTVARYETAFAHGSAVEIFTWTRESGTLKLYGYNIQSNAFILEQKPLPTAPIP
jgi:hypothetical protein